MESLHHHRSIGKAQLVKLAAVSKPQRADDGARMARTRSGLCTDTPREARGRQQWSGLSRIASLTPRPCRNTRAVSIRDSSIEASSNNPAWRTRTFRLVQAASSGAVSPSRDIGTGLYQRHRATRRPRRASGSRPCPDPDSAPPLPSHQPQHAAAAVARRVENKAERVVTGQNLDGRDAHPDRGASQPVVGASPLHGIAT